MTTDSSNWSGNDLFFEPAQAKQLNMRVTISIDKELYELVQGLLVHPDLSYEGNISLFAREAMFRLVEERQKFLDAGRRTLAGYMRELRARLETERFVLSLEDLITIQVEHWTRWSSLGEWTAVTTGLKEWRARLQDMPPSWRGRAAITISSHRGMRNLRRHWHDEMPEEHQGVVSKFFADLDTLSKHA